MLTGKYLVGSFTVVKIEDEYVFLQITGERDSHPVVLQQDDTIEVYFTPDKCSCCGRELYE